MKKTIPLFIIFLFAGLLNGQNFHRLDVPVTVNGTSLLNPWAGGLNAPQWAKVELNNDGKPDLYAFDRNGFVHLSFINIGEAGEAKYQFQPFWVKNFPLVHHFLLLRDYNRDGAIDVFGHGQDEGLAAIKVYKGRFQGNQLQYERILFPDHEFDVIPYQFDGESVTIEMNPSDYPAVDDLDGDGDLDMLVLGINADRINYFKNVALESGYTDEVLLFEPGDDCWGKFNITPFSPSLTLSDDPENCAFGQPKVTAVDRSGPVHGGSTMCTFDADNDGDKELLYGDLIYPYLVYGHNNGNSEQAWITEQDSTYPTLDVPVVIPDFPAAYYLDIDNDGARDMVASPNLAVTSPDQETAWFYRNTGTDEFPDFELQQKDFLGETMLDFGSRAHPAFADVNADGLIDLVVGNGGAFVETFIDDVFLVLFLNVGTPEEPAFELVDEDWLGFSQFDDFTKSFSPNFGDLDGDGDLDLITGDDEGGFFYAENLAGSGEPMNFAPTIPHWKSIFVGRNSMPFIHDINKDGLADLLVGERNGNVNYLPNIGSVGNPDFHPNVSEAPNNEAFGEISSQFGGSFVGYSAPVVLEFAEETFIITGSDRGWIKRYLLDQDSIDGGTFPLLDEKFGGLRDGHITAPAFTDLNGDIYLDMVLGNFRGGLGIFQSPITVDGLVDATEVIRNETPGVEIFPNPATELVQVNLSTSEWTQTMTYRIYNAYGQLVQNGNLSGKSSNINIDQLTPGIYFFAVELDQERVVKKIVVQ